MSRESILKTAAAENGTKESPANSNKTKYGDWYKLNGVKWCAIFVSYVYDHAGHPLEHVDTEKGYQSCQSGYNYWKRKGRIVKEPQPADIVLYDWTGDGVCDHTGIFVRWIDANKTTFESWEGNTAIGNNSDGGQVMLRQRKRSMVRAFVTPDVFEGAPPVVSNDDVLEKGDVGTNVTVLQKMLFDLQYKIKVDGDFGPATEGVVKQFQKDHSLAITGKVTPEVWGAIQEEVSLPRVGEKKLTTGSFIRRGNSGNMVLLIQKALNAKGITPAVAEDGVFESTTFSAVKEFQRKNGLDVDGIVGPQTFDALGIGNS